MEWNTLSKLKLGDVAHCIEFPSLALLPEAQDKMGIKVPGPIRASVSIGSDF